MTCSSCESKVEASLMAFDGVISAKASKEASVVEIESRSLLQLHRLQPLLDEKYQLSIYDISTASELKNSHSKLQQLFPLVMILSYVLAGSIGLNIDDFFYQSFMLDFMGLFFIVFSFFKLLDLKGFVSSFRMYDPLANKWPTYGWLYPFIEVFLGLLFLFRENIVLSLWMTIGVLGITTIGVTKSLLNKTPITCACLGSVLNLPMTLATFIENIIMIIMAVLMLLTLN